MATDYSLHPQLAADCFVLGQLGQCDLLRFNGDAYPWFILVPRFADLREWHHLSHDHQTQVFQTSMKLSQFIEQNYNPDKLNIAALGNMVPQLHIHHVARFTQDAAWPKPIWGSAAGEPLDAAFVASLQEQINNAFGEAFCPNNLSA
ncbi:MAG: HIT domain-containing protein [Pseudomonadota bacterium]|nr:HIT domain-containing protein [Pseudomonadota bacterium]